MICRNSLIVLGILVVLGLALTATFVCGSARQAGQFDYSSNGSLIAGWHWLRSNGQTATWTFDTRELRGARDVYINFNPLVTNGVNGGSGYDTACHLLIEGATTRTINVLVVNPYRPVDPSNSGGVGYQCYGHSPTSIPPSVYTNVARIKVRISYPFASGRHVAVNAACMTLGYSK
jgi:hypothetical protein